MLGIKRIVHNQAGDTIVEVMLAMAIVASVLGASYATASRSLRTGRQAQERSEALKYVESQIEQIKYLAKGKKSGEAPFVGAAGPNPFCVKPDNSGIVSATDAQCTYGSLYKISVQYSPRATGGTDAENKDDRFSVKATWERIGGGTDEMTVVYKLHPGVE